MATRAGSADEEVLAEVQAANIPALQGSREALRALGHFEDYSQRLVRSKTPSLPWPQPSGGISALLKNKDVVGQAELFDYLAENGLATATMRRVGSKTEAEQAARELGSPVVMKIDTARVVHKSDIGGVALDVTPENAAQTYEKLLNCLDPPLGSFPGEGIVAAKQIESGVEVYIGSEAGRELRLRSGFWAGRTIARALNRNAMLVVPFDQSDALEAIERSGVHPFLNGFRGGPEADFAELARMMVRVGQIAASIGDRLEVLDLNPVIVNARYPGGIIADARLLLLPEPQP